MDHRKYIDDLCTALRGIPDSEIASARSALESAFREDRTVFVAGNGGSAATASHLACDFQKTTLAKEHGRVTHRIRCISLSDNMPLVTAWGNDVHYDEIFGQQLRALGRSGDLLIVITASGNSPNILNALRAGKELGVTTIGFLGFGGGKALPLCDYPIVVPSSDYGVVEDSHSVLMHMLTAGLRELVLG